MQITQHKLFPTLVTEIEGFITPEQCADLVNYGSALSTTRHGAIHGDGKSYFTDTSKFLDLVGDSVESCRTIKDQIQTEINNFTKTAGFMDCHKIGNSWFNIQNVGSTLQKHTHPLATISGALYVNVDENSSPLVFYNPNPYIDFSSVSETEYTEFTYSWYSFKPKIGTMLLFPSWLSHGSNNIQNNTPNRMVISFNA